jgi:hypothetical protein
MKSDRYIIIHQKNGYWVGHAYIPGWCLIALPRLTEIDALIATLSIIQGEFNG